VTGLLAQGIASPADDASTVAGARIAKNPADLHWKVKDTLPQTPSPAHSAVAWGDPAKDAYAFFGKFPAGFTVPMRWHTNGTGGDDEEQHGDHARGGYRSALRKGLLPAVGEDEIRGPVRAEYVFLVLGR
jgi:hypothetical protein